MPISTILVTRSSVAASSRARVEHLGDDFADAQMAHEAHLAGRTEDAAHRAAGLGANTERAPLLIAHEHRFDELTVGEPKEVLSRLTIAGVELHNRV